MANREHLPSIALGEKSWNVRSEHGDKSVVQIRVNTWEGAVVLGKALARHVFRGQSNAQWFLSTTLERAGQRYGWSITELRKREVVLLDTFQRRAHHYVNAPPSVLDRLEWFALMQHHGAPTRLLDFSHSFYVGAFFAMEFAQQDAAIWALSDVFTMKHTSNLIMRAKLISDLNEESRAVVETHFSGHQNSACVMLVEPHRMNDRLAAQQGCFVVPGNINKTFMENLALGLEVDVVALLAERARSMRRPDRDRGGLLSNTSVVKVILPQKIHNAALFDLAQMNVTAASLFPGLDGFARSLHGWFRDVV
jgi:hypothetical protein